MRSHSRIIPVLLVAATVVLGIAIIVVSIYSNRLRLERETVIAAAKYDGDALLAQLNEMPATSIDFLESDSGPDHPDLREAREAWVTWKQSYSSTESFAKIVDWHRTRLESLGWKAGEESDPDKTTFTRDEWTFTLLRLPGGKASNTLLFQRQIDWRVTL